MSNETIYRGSCFCGAVELRVTGEPAAMGYCHCNSCRKWSAGPINGFTLWKPSAVQVTKGADQIGTYNKTPQSFRKWCKVCGGHLFTEHPPWELTVQARRARALSGDCASHPRRTAEDEGRPEGDGRVGRYAARIAAAGPVFFGIFN
jgi:hypothetical protein